MITKLLLFTCIAICQAAENEPWWIQMFFPNMSFTGRYHPSNYKVEKSPLFPDYVQNPNDVWSPAYWMPYKLAYSQYWIDLIDNTTKEQQEKTQAQAAEQWLGYQSAHNGQYGMGGQFGQNGQYGVVGQFQDIPVSQEQIIVQEASSLAQQIQMQAENMKTEAHQIVTQAKQDANKQMQTVVEKANQKRQEVIAEAQFFSSQGEKVSAQIDQAVEAKEKAIAEIQESKLLKKEVENEIQAIKEEAAKKKQEIAAQVEFTSRQADKVSTQIDQVAEAKVEAIAQEINQFEGDIKRQFTLLYDEAEEIALEASRIAKKIQRKKF